MDALIFSEANGELLDVDPELLRLTEQAAAVSFDFFDTLFTRPLANPEDTFDILARQFGIIDFRKQRQAAQAKAFSRMQIAGLKEISLMDIYTCLDNNKFPCEALMRAEYALEKALLEPHPEMLALCRALRDAGKPVAITSDMYLGSDFFREILRSYDLTDVPLFISADCNATKRDTGELLDIVATSLGTLKQDVLHIGDNLHADVNQARARGLQAFHYRPYKLPDDLYQQPESLDASIGQGLLRTCARRSILPNSFAALGYLYGGPANLGFLQWIADRARLDNIDHLLFLSRDGYTLERLASTGIVGSLPKFCYFLGSRTAYTLAAMTENNFTGFLPFLLSGSYNLSPAELLERIGVTPPAPRIMNQLGLGENIHITPVIHDRLARFLYALRWDILSVGRRNRSTLFRYLHQAGVRAGDRVALVDVGWSGTTQEAFELAVRPLMPLEVFGYYFCLANTPERLQRSQKQNMAALINNVTTEPATVASLYENRVTVELFFSAPHSSIIGLIDGCQEVEPIYDAGRGDTASLANIAADICRGCESFAAHYIDLCERLDLPTTPLQTAWPLVEWILSKRSEYHPLLKQICNFDAWASTRHKT